MKKTITFILNSPEFSHPRIDGAKDNSTFSFEVEVDDTPKPFLILKRGQCKEYYGSPDKEPCHACKGGPVKYVGHTEDWWLTHYECEACKSKFELMMPSTGEDGSLSRVKQFHK